jgi:hypothetical protein
MSSWLRDCHIRLCLAVFIAAEAVSGAVPATAEPKEPSIEQAQSQSDSEQEPAEYNGGDITRPQNQLDVRLQYRTSWQPDTRTQQERMLLRVTSKLKLDAGWRAGLLGEAPFVDKRTTTFDSNNSGNASRSENKFGVAMRRSRLIWPTTSTKTGLLDSARAGLALRRKTRWEAESGKSCRA